MADADRFARSYLFVDVHSPATGESVADLLEAAAAALRGVGEVNVHHIAFDTSEGGHSVTTGLTVYYDRVERRRHHRGPTDPPGHAARRSLRPVD